jgi:glycine C-acetyltransferase
LELIRTQPELKERLWRNSNALKDGLREAGFDLGLSDACVTPVYMHGTPYEAANLVHDIRNRHHIFCSMVIYPMIPKGMILLRMIPTAVHTQEDIDQTIEAFIAVSKRLKAGEYQGELKFVSTQLA